LTPSAPALGAAMAHSTASPIAATTLSNGTSVRRLRASELALTVAHS